MFRQHILEIVKQDAHLVSLMLMDEIIVWSHVVSINLFAPISTLSNHVLYWLVYPLCRHQCQSDIL